MCVVCDWLLVVLVSFDVCGLVLCGVWCCLLVVCFRSLRIVVCCVVLLFALMVIVFVAVLNVC